MVYSLLQSSDTSYAYPLTQQASSGEDTTESASEESQEATEATTTEGAATTSFDTDSAVRGANTVMALSQSQQSTGSDLIESDVIVLGSMAMMDYYLTQDSSYNNAEYFIGVLNSVCGKEDSIVIASKDMTATSISATQTQLVTLRTIVVFLIPLAVAAAGIVVFLRRRNR